MRFKFFSEWLNWLWVFAVRFWNNKQNGPTITSRDNSDYIPVLHSPALPSGKVFAVRFRKNRQNDPTITSRRHDNSDSIPSPAYVVSARIEQGVTPGVSNMVRLALARVQDIAGPISLVGSPLQAAFNGLLTIFQTIDRHPQNKAAIASLIRRLHRLWRHLCNVPSAHIGPEQFRRDDLMSLLQGTSNQLTKLDSEGLGYQSVIEVLAKFSTELDQYLAEYTFATKMYTQHYVVEIDTQLQQFRGSAAVDLAGTVTRHCIILVDATGREHKIPTEFCMSYRQLKNLLNVLFAPNTDISYIQRRYLEEGRYDLCIDQGTQITELTSETDAWSSIEAGTKVIMRVIITKDVYGSSDIECDGCGYSNFSVESADARRRDYWTVYCRECHRRYQISGHSLARYRDGITINPAMMYLIRNIHIQETLRLFFFGGGVCHLILRAH